MSTRSIRVNNFTTRTEGHRIGLVVVQPQVAGEIPLSRDMEVDYFKQKFVGRPVSEEGARNEEGAILFIDRQ